MGFLAIVVNSVETETKSSYTASGRLTVFTIAVTSYKNMLGFYSINYSYLKLARPSSVLGKTIKTTQTMKRD